MLNLIPENIRPYVLRALAFVKGLSRPVKVFTVTTIVAAIALASYVSVRSANPTYAVLYANMDREDAAAVVAKLKEMKVPYKLEGEGTTVEVPEAQARELRLELAGGGLPRGGSVGFESFDKMRLGATEFEQRILYRRALEGELARTIGSLAAVQSARVHLVLPEKSVFVSRNEPASASVVVKLRSGRTLGGGEIGSIVHLVSSSVAGLTPDRVALVGTDGTVLHKPRRPGDEAGGSDDDRASQTRTLEATLEERARGMVEKVVGAGHVDVRVTAELDTARTERVEDRYDPARSSLRSEERSIERMGEDAAGATGVPGAQSNLPNGDGRAVDGGAGTPGAIRESHTRNFELDHVVEKRFIASGTLRRVTVAVVVDGVPLTGAPRGKEEMEKISALVRSAVGADEKRGDLVTVESVPFIAPVAEPALPDAPAPFVFQPRRHGPYAAAAAVAVLAGVIAMTLSLRRRSRRKAAEAVVAKAADDEAVAAGKATIAVSEHGDEHVKALEPTADELRKLVQERVSSDPATAALILRQWLGASEATRQEAA